MNKLNFVDTSKGVKIILAENDGQVMENFKCDNSALP